MTEPVASSPVEAIVTRDVEAALRLRLHRMTSATICRRMLASKHPGMPEEAIAQKAEGVASALRSALGYWESGRDALNAKILSQYYFALQLSIAEEVANANPDATLESIQKHTEQGHGLGTIRPPDGAFPGEYYIAALKFGHFGAYCASAGIDLDGIAFDAKPRSWSKIKDGDFPKLVSLSQLLRRVPELRTSVYECLNEPALSFHVVSSSKNLQFEAEQASANLFKGVPSEGDGASKVGSDIGDITTYLTFATGYGGGEGGTPEYLSGLSFPISDFCVEFDSIFDKEQITGTYKHSAGQQWFDSIGLYHSDVGSSLIAPMWGKKPNIFLIHFMTLYALSIVVRYLPSFWYKIEHGELDHVRALLEQYVTIVDTAVPKLAIERITGRRIAVVNPGSLNAPL